MLQDRTEQRWRSKTREQDWDSYRDRNREKEGRETVKVTVLEVGTF